MSKFCDSCEKAIKEMRTTKGCDLDLEDLANLCGKCRSTAVRQAIESWIPPIVRRQK